MRELFKETWFKIVAIVLVIGVLYAVFLFSTGRGKPIPLISTQDVAMESSAPGFAGEFAGFGGKNLAVSDEALTRGMMPPIPSGAGTTDPDQARIIQTGFLMIEVDDAAASIDSVRGVAERLGGFLINSNFRESETGQKSASAQIKVPFDAFNQAMSDIKQAAVFVGQESINSQDVTEEYTDLQSQLKNLKAEEEQYLAIMQRAIQIEDVLNVASRLADVRGRIEQIQGRIQYYDNRTEFSIINIEVTEEQIVKAPAQKWRPLHEIKQQAQQLVVRLQDFVNNVIAFIFWLVSIIPYLLVLGIVIWLVRRFILRKGSAAVKNQ